LPIDTGLEEPMLQPPPPIIKQPLASFYFHPEDEEEAAKLQAKAKDAGAGKSYSLGKIAEKAIASYQLTLDPALAGRFKTTLFSFLRDRRTLVDFQEALKRPQAEGGLALAAELTEKITNFLKEIKEKIAAEGGLVIDRQEEERIMQKSPALAGGDKLVNRPSPILFQTLSKSGQRPEAALAGRPLAPITPVASEGVKKTSLPLRRPLKRGTINDVKKEYKLIGPLEELAGLDLTTFHRLGDNTVDRATKVVSRIESLIKDSLTRKAAGIKAWRSSPLYRMYIAVGQASMEHSIDVAQIIDQYQQANKEIISLEEFEAITDINRQLRF